MADIRIDRVAKSFGPVRALDEVVLDVADGEFVALLGPSGCGKTTLLRIIAGLETQSAGRIVIGGRDVSDLPARQRGLAMVFQNYAVFPHMTVFENIAFGLRTQRADAERVRRRVRPAARGCTGAGWGGRIRRGRSIAGRAGDSGAPSLAARR